MKVFDESSGVEKRRERNNIEKLSSFVFYIKSKVRMYGWLTDASIVASTCQQIQCI